MKKLLIAFLLALSLIGQNAHAATIEIRSGQIVDNSITDNDLANGSVNSLKISDNAITEPKLASVDIPNDEECLTYESGSTQFEWQTCGSTNIDDAYNNSASGNKVIVVDDGTFTLQASGTSAGLAITRSDNTTDYARIGNFTVQSDNDVGVGASDPSSPNGRDQVFQVSAQNKGNTGLAGINLKGGAGLSGTRNWEMYQGGFSATEAFLVFSGDTTPVMSMRENGNVAIAQGSKLFFDDVAQLTSNDYITVATSDNMTFGVSDNNVMSIVSNGVKIGNKETISIYDEGTFTPTVTLVGGSGNAIPQYIANEGNFIKFGRLVIATYVLLGDAGTDGAGSGQLNLAAPFPGAAFTNGQCNTGAVLQNGTTFYNIQGCIESNATTIRLYKQDSISNYGTATGADQSNAARSFYVVFMYISNS